MKGILLSQIGGDYALVEDLEKPAPGPNQILVKSLVTAINPVEPFMQSTGILITTFPIVLGCDSSGTVAAIGSEVTKFAVGDGVFGCTVLGVPGHSTFQEYFLMDEDLTFKKPEGWTREDAATVGVGLITASLALVIGTKMELVPATCGDGSSWVLVLGAAGSVGQYGIQLAKLCGYKVLASCSKSNNEMVKGFGADATFDYKVPLVEQLEEIKKITGGNFSRVFDASAFSTETGMEALAQIADKTESQKCFATTNDWVPVEPKEGVEVYCVTLGEIGRKGNEHIEKTNKDISELISRLQGYLYDGRLKPLEYVQIGDVGIGEVLKGLEAFNSHKSGKKIIVRLAEE